jgi:hypothetical protein
LLVVLEIVLALALLVALAQGEISTPLAERAAMGLMLAAVVAVVLLQGRAMVAMALMGLSVWAAAVVGPGAIMLLAARAVSLQLQKTALSTA